MAIECINTVEIRLLDCRLLPAFMPIEVALAHPQSKR